MTLPAKRLRAELRRTSLHVRRQAPVGRCIADFVIHDRRLVIEVDGVRLDEEQLHDAERDAWFATQGCRLLRFASARVLAELDGVPADIRAAVRPPALPPAADGIGG